jgi:hypothetical protein
MIYLEETPVKEPRAGVICALGVEVHLRRANATMTAESAERHCRMHDATGVRMVMMTSRPHWRWRSHALSAFLRISISSGQRADDSNMLRPMPHLFLPLMSRKENLCWVYTKRRCSPESIFSAQRHRHHFEHSHRLLSFGKRNAEEFYSLSSPVSFDSNA